MDFEFDARTEQLRAELVDFMVNQVHPAESVFAEQLAALDNQWAPELAPGLPSLSTRDRPAIMPAVFTLMWMLPNRLMAALTPADIAWLLAMSAPTPIAFPSSAAI
jgi:hypothetical protein